MGVKAIACLLSVSVLGLACGGADPGVQVTGSVRQVAPLSTATASSRRPTFRWALAGDAAGAQIQVCRDRACAVEVTTFTASGTRGVPPSDLPPGVLFWRARAARGGQVGESLTPSWEITVLAHTGAVDTSWGSTLDVNGDGYADVAMAANVFLGSAQGPSPTPSITLAPLDDSGGFSINGPEGSAGDVNGDGYADFVVRDSATPSDMDGAYVYLGGSEGLHAGPSATLRGHVANFGSPGWVAGAGDVNGDGYGDIVVGDTTGTPRTAAVYLGGPDGPSTSPAITLTSPNPNPVFGEFFGEFVGSAGDVNGDGYADIVVGTGAPDSPAALIYVYLGGPNGTESAPVVGFVNPGGAINDAARTSAGDVNGDGYTDIVLGVPSVNGTAYLYLGGRGGPSSYPDVTLYGGQDGTFGLSVACVGDIDGDGFSDILIGDPGIPPGGDLPGTPGYRGAAYLYLGGPAGPSGAPSSIIANPETFFGLAAFGQVVSGVGDVNGDGYPDVSASIGYPGEYIFLGGPAGLALMPAVMLH